MSKNNYSTSGNTSDPCITLSNYKEHTAGMKSLVWDLTEKNLKANGMLQMYLEETGKIAVPDSAESKQLAESLLAHAWNDTKLRPGSEERENMLYVQKKIGYEFGNERLLLQAFTRRSFITDGMLRGADYEVLETAGDSLMSAAVMRTILRQHAHFMLSSEDGSVFLCDYDEGDISRIRQKYTCKDYLSSRCAELGFDNFIRWGKDDDQSRPDAREDVMEAIVAAVAVDCDWDMDIVEDVVEELLNIHLALDPWTPEKDHFDILNSWWQKRFGVRPEYRIHKSADTYTDGRALYECDLTISLSMLDPERDWDAWCSDSDWEEHALVYGKYGEDITFHSRRISKSEARSMCAEQCIQFLKAAGLFMNLKDCGVTPRLDDAINQLQILHQRGYVGEARYEFIDGDDFWECTCTVDSFWDGADAAGKKESKKLAAFSVLIQIMRSAGIDDPEWEKVFERPGGNLSI